jgi:hypothetical protein
MKRIFLIGAPRSGTTMLQSLLASHPSIISFPETKFFHYLLYDQFSQSLPKRLEKFFVDELKRPELLKNWSGGQSDLDKAHCFIKILDELAEEQEKCIWLEKTPEHIYFIDYLENLLPNALFIHILRNGIDVIASMYEANRKSPEAWGGIWNLDFCIKRWQEAISISNQYVEKDNHLLIKYEQILENPKINLSKICDFIQIDFNDLMLINYQKTAKKLSLELPWHQGIDRDIQASETPKYKKIFNKDEIEYILQKIKPVTFGITHTVRLEVTESICDIFTPELTERLYCVVECEGTQLGTLELPVCDGLVAGYVLKDAIAAEFAWVLLGRFFQRTVYQDLHIEQESTGLALWQGTLRLAEGLSEGEQFWIQAHDQVGWTIFLQELWGHSDWSQEIFYDPQAAEQKRNEGKNNSQSPAEHSTDGCHVVEVSGELADVKLSGQFLNVVLTVGGIAIGVFTIPTESGIVSAGQLQVALTIESGFELCRAVVREGLLGRPLADGVSLRKRLAQAAAVRHTQDTSELEASVPGLAPGTASALSEVSRLSENMLLLGHRIAETIRLLSHRFFGRG